MSTARHDPGGRIYLIAGLIAGELKADAVGEMPGQYLRILIMPVLAGIGLVILARPIKKWTGGVE